MEKFRYIGWQEDYENSVDEYGDPQLFSESGDFFINIIEGCGLKVSAYSHRLLDRGVGGVKLEDLRRSQVSDRMMQLTANEPPLKHSGRELLRVYLLIATAELSWPEEMDALSDIKNRSNNSEFRGAVRILPWMLGA